MNTDQPTPREEALSEMDSIREYVSKMTPQEIQQIHDHYWERKSGGIVYCSKCGATNEHATQPEPEFNHSSGREVDKPEPAKDEWRVTTPEKGGVFVENHKGIIAVIWLPNKKETEAIAKQIVEDHRRIAFLEAAADCGASGWSETLQKFTESIAEIKKLRAQIVDGNFAVAALGRENNNLRAELEAMRKALGIYGTHRAGCGQGMNGCTCGLSALLTADRVRQSAETSKGAPAE